MAESTIVHCGVGFLVAIISIPLVLRMVPMNRLYGVRIPKAFTSDENWYAVNAYGGKLLTAYGLFLIFFGIATRDYAPTDMWQIAFVLGPILLIIPVLAMIFSYAKGLPD